MIKKAHLRHIRETLPFAGILIAGTLIFWHRKFGHASGF